MTATTNAPSATVQSLPEPQTRILLPLHFIVILLCFYRAYRDRSFSDSSRLTHIDVASRSDTTAKNIKRAIPL